MGRLKKIWTGIKKGAKTTAKYGRKAGKTISKEARTGYKVLKSDIKGYKGTPYKPKKKKSKTKYVFKGWKNVPVKKKGGGWTIKKVPIVKRKK